MELFFVVPVDEDMTRRREDVGGANLRERNDFFSFWRRGREVKRGTLRMRPVLSGARIVKNSSVEENVGRS